MAADKFHLFLCVGLKLGLAVVFVFAGLLDALGIGPALSLIAQTYTSIAGSQILNITLATLEVAVGIGIMIPGISRAALWVAVWHLTVITVSVLISAQALETPLTLGFIGEYVLKSIVLILATLGLIYHEKELQSRWFGT